MTQQYEQDPVNGKFYPKAEECLSDAEWEALQKRWAPRKNHQKSISDKIAFWLLIITILYMAAQWIRVAL